MRLGDSAMREIQKGEGAEEAVPWWGKQRR
jgi:hypothetical protein